MASPIEKVKTERLWNRNYLRVMFANFAMYFAFYLLTPLFPLYLAETFGATKDTIGVVLSGYIWAALIIRPFSGYLVDRFSRKRILCICASLFFIFFAGYLFAGTLLMFAIVRTLHGAPFGAFSVANTTVAIDVLPPSRRMEGIGFYGLSNNIGMALGPIIGVWLYNLTGNFDVLFWCALAVAGLGASIGCMVSTRETRRDFQITTTEKETQQQEDGTPIHNQLRTALNKIFLTRAWLLAINIAFFGFCFGGLSNYIAIYTKHTFGNADYSGIWFCILSSGLALSRLQGASALRKGRVVHNCSEGVLISLVGYSLFAFLSLANTNGTTTATLTAYYLSAVLIGLGNGHMYPAFLNMFICVARSNERGTANSTILTSWDSGFGIGILLCGIVAELLGYGMAFGLVALFNLMGVLLYFLCTRSFFQRKRLD